MKVRQWKAWAGLFYDSNDRRFPVVFRTHKGAEEFVDPEDVIRVFITEIEEAPRRAYRIADKEAPRGK